MSNSPILLPRRRLLASAGAATGALLLSGCDRLNSSPGFRSFLQGAEGLHAGTQSLLGSGALAREYAESDMSPQFRANGNVTGHTPDWVSQAATGFDTWALRIDGFVKQPIALPLAALKAMQQREQITRHDCVEGWSAIGKWQGPQLSQVLSMAGLLPAARFIVFHCADATGTAPYYESISLAEAFHPQTILAWRMNGEPLPVAHGAPLRLRAERQLGYKQAKYVMRIEARASLEGLYGGKGGYWEDHKDYYWHAGI